MVVIISDNIESIKGMHDTYLILNKQCHFQKCLKTYHYKTHQQSIFKICYFLLSRNQWEKNFVTLHISFFIDSKVIFLRQLVMSAFTVLLVFFSFYISGSAETGLHFITFELISTGQRGATFTPSTWNRTINNQYCSTMGPPL